MVAQPDRCAVPPAIHTVRTACSQVRWARLGLKTADEENDVLQDLVTMTTAVSGVGVLLVMLVSGLVPLSAPEPARVLVRAAERPGGR